MVSSFSVVIIKKISVKWFIGNDRYWNTHNDPKYIGTCLTINLFRGHGRSTPIYTTAEIELNISNNNGIDMCVIDDCMSDSDSSLIYNTHAENNRNRAMKPLASPDRWHMMVIKQCSIQTYTLEMYVHNYTSQYEIQNFANGISSDVVTIKQGMICVFAIPIFN